MYLYLENKFRDSCKIREICMNCYKPFASFKSFLFNILSFLLVGVAYFIASWLNVDIYAFIPVEAVRYLLFAHFSYVICKYHSLVTWKITYIILFEVAMVLLVAIVTYPTPSYNGHWDDLSRSLSKTGAIHFFIYFSLKKR